MYAFTVVQSVCFLQLFERLRKENPSALRKIIAIEGDLTEKNLGLTAEQKNRLINEVEVVFNGAASLRLEAGMKAAIENNTLGTLRVLELCKEIKNLHVSRIYVFAPHYCCLVAGFGYTDFVWIYVPYNLLTNKFILKMR